MSDTQPAVNGASKNDRQSTEPRPFGGAPFNNRNAIRHGLKTGTLPKGAFYIRKITDELRRQLEDHVMAARGAVSMIEAATIQTAVRWERHAMLAQRWLNREVDSMTMEQRLAFSREIARASAERDRCLRALDLDSDSQNDLFDSLRIIDAKSGTSESAADDAQNVQKSGSEAQQD